MISTKAKPSAKQIPSTLPVGDLTKFNSSSCRFLVGVIIGAGFSVVNFAVSGIMGAGVGRGIGGATDEGGEGAV
jgi:hypothetical protein